MTQKSVGLVPKSRRWLKLTIRVRKSSPRPSKRVPYRRVKKYMAGQSWKIENLPQQSRKCLIGLLIFSFKNSGRDINRGGLGRSWTKLSFLWGSLSPKKDVIAGKTLTQKICLEPVALLALFRVIFHPIVCVPKNYARDTTKVSNWRKSNSAPNPKLKWPNSTLRRTRSLKIEKKIWNFPNVTLQLFGLNYSETVDATSQYLLPLESPFNIDTNDM